MTNPGSSDSTHPALQAPARIPKQIELEAALLDQVRETFLDGYGSVLKDMDPNTLGNISRDALNPERNREQLRMLERCIGEQIRGKRVLEAGSGNGLTVAVARAEFGADAFGIEPSDNEYSGSFEVCRQLLQMCNVTNDAVVRGVGEDMPFPDQHFDCVFSSQVMEHVQEPQRVIDESLRVLRSGGYLHIVVPNYGSFWEGHYGTPWIPHMPLRLARLYIRLFRRDPSFLDSLQFISHGSLVRMLRPHRHDVEVLGWGMDVFAERMHSLEFSKWGALGIVERWVNRLHKLGLVRPVVALARLFHWQTPVILTLRKK